jgi:hypothetical protein
LEDQAAENRLDDGARLVNCLKQIAKELLKQIDGLSIDALQSLVKRSASLRIDAAD